jgi:hypothetical protein
MIGKHFIGSLVLLLFAGVMTACLGETKKGSDTSGDET